jgi:hypothetical protein
MATFCFSLAGDDVTTQIYGLCLIPVSVSVLVYALTKYIQRVRMLRSKQSGPYEDRTGPIYLGILIGIVLFANFIIKIVQFAL